LAVGVVFLGLSDSEAAIMAGVFDSVEFTVVDLGGGLGVIGTFAHVASDSLRLHGIQSQI
jgi:hypothetical protein